MQLRKHPKTRTPNQSLTSFCTVQFGPSPSNNHAQFFFFFLPFLCPHCRPQIVASSPRVSQSVTLSTGLLRAILLVERILISPDQQLRFPLEPRDLDRIFLVRALLPPPPPPLPPPHQPRCSPPCCAGKPCSHDPLSDMSFLPPPASQGGTPRTHHTRSSACPLCRPP